MAYHHTGDPYFSTNPFLNMLNLIDELEQAPAQAGQPVVQQAAPVAPEGTGRVKLPEF
jgi:hypothetical protein